MKPGSRGPFSYSPITSRPRLNWPNGARVAFWVIPNIEVFHLNHRMPAGSGRVPDVSAWGARDYGNRVGIFRVMDVMETARRSGHRSPQQRLLHGVS